jgi:hypothetical protein
VTECRRSAQRLLTEQFVPDVAAFVAVKPAVRKARDWRLFFDLIVRLASWARR